MATGSGGSSSTFLPMEFIQILIHQHAKTLIALKVNLGYIIYLFVVMTTKINISITTDAPLGSPHIKKATPPTPTPTIIPPLPPLFLLPPPKTTPTFIPPPPSPRFRSLFYKILLKVLLHPWRRIVLVAKSDPGQDHVSENPAHPSPATPTRLP